jgi:hypothetical protein
VSEAGGFNRLALKVVMRNDGDFADVILLYKCFHWRFYNLTLGVVKIFVVVIF